jgi:DNA helicase-2/ATP-dependent DNA helicase PcrA
MDSDSWSSTPQQMGYPPIDFRADLNDEQYAAVTAPDGPALVLAGAGSGKTRTLIYRVAYLLENGVHPGNILLLTFTNKAAREMLSRVEDLTGVPRRAFWGGTFHSIGQRMLRMHGEPIGMKSNYTILDQSDAESLMTSVIRGVDAFFLKNKNNPKAKVIANAISLSRNTCQSVEDSIHQFTPYFEEFIPDFEKFYLAYQTKKKQQQVADYDDLLVYWLEILKTQEQIAHYYQNRFQYILVDEYQDTNKIQALIIDLIGNRNQIMAVGDDAQSIYSWRGANYENILTFPDRHPGTEILRIEINYRSTPEILSFANAIIQNRSTRGFDKELRAFKPSSQAPYIVQAMDTKEQAQFVINRIHGLLNEGKDAREIAILYRAHYQSLDMQMELSRSGIAYQITSGVRFFEQAHIKDMVAHLRLVYNPRDVSAFMRLAILLPKIGEKSAQKLYALAVEIAKSKQIDFIDALSDDVVIKKAPAVARQDWESLAQSLQDMKQVNDSGTPEEVVQMGLDGWYSLYLQGAYANYVSRMDDLSSLVGFAARFEEMQDLISQITLLTSEVSDRSMKDSDQSIRLTTVHQAKGLEFDVVFVIGAAEGLFPIRRAVESGDTEEERRLFYVAVTRARDELYLLYPKMNTKGGGSMFLTPSRFIQEVSKELYEPVRIRRNYGW